MMTLVAKDLTRNRLVARRFGARAGDYDAHAGLQRDIAARLAGLLPAHDAPSVLEVGCGTGFLTRHLLEAYPNGDFLITDLAPEMLAACKQRHGRARRGGLRFEVMDGEVPDRAETFDVIALSMTLQWFADPLTGLARLRERLNPGGSIVYATLGPDCFPEWREALAAEGLPDGTAAMPELPGIVSEVREQVRYTSARAFLGEMRAIGAGEPRPGYRPLAPGKLRRALRGLEEGSGARVTWHLVFGRITLPANG
jgi:malonyl-CoA O-methyltransferase